MTSDERLIADYSGTDLMIGKHPMEYRRAELRRERPAIKFAHRQTTDALEGRARGLCKRHPTTQTDHPVKQKAKGRIPFRDLVPRYPCYRRTGFGYQLAPPTGEGEVWLQYLQGKTTVWWTILSLCVLTDFLYIPVALALYFALERVNRSAMLLASVFVGLFVALDLAVTWANYAAILTLSGLYAAVPNEVQRAGYVAAANYASAVLASPTEVFYAIVDLSIGIFIISFVMLRDRRIFKRTTAYLGLAAGIFGFISVGGFFIAVMLHTVLITIWFLLVGYRLCSLGWNHSDMNLALRGVSQAVD
jgi:hypothetical protein